MTHIVKIKNKFLIRRWRLVWQYLDMEYEGGYWWWLASHWQTYASKFDSAENASFAWESWKTGRKSRKKEKPQFIGWLS